MELIKIENDLITASEELTNIILDIKNLEERLKAKKENLSLSLLEEMKAKDIKKIETPDVVITYVDETERETFDTKKFKEDFPDMYDDYVKFTKVKANVRIKAR